MKRFFILLLALCLTLCACGSGGGETTAPTTQPQTVPETTEPVSASVDIVDRMATLREEDVCSFYDLYPELDLTQLVAAMNAAAEHPIQREELLHTFYDLDLYLDEALSNHSEHFYLYAGLEENIVKVLYQDPEGNHDSGYFESAELYWFLRNRYRTVDHVDTEAYETYRADIEALAAKTVAETLNAKGEQAFQGYEVVEFALVEEFDEYTVYSWDVAFYTDDPVSAPYAGGMYLDAEGRLRAVIEETYFVVRNDGETRFLFWDLYWGDTEEQCAENAHTRIREAFTE